MPQNTPRRFVVREIGADGAPVLTKGVASFNSEYEAEQDAKQRLAQKPNATFAILVPVKSFFKQEPARPRLPDFPVGTTRHADCR